MDGRLIAGLAFGSHHCGASCRQCRGERKMLDRLDTFALDQAIEREVNRRLMDSVYQRALGGPDGRP